MFSIVDCTIISKETDFDISASINEILGCIELECKIPIDRKVGFELLASTRKNLADNRLYTTGEKVEIPLRRHNSDSFTLKISDENGNAISKYSIMRCYC